MLIGSSAALGERTERSQRLLSGCLGMVAINMALSVTHLLGEAPAGDVLPGLDSADSAQAPDEQAENPEQGLPEHEFAALAAELQREMLQRRAARLPRLVRTDVGVRGTTRDGSLPAEAPLEKSESAPTPAQAQGSSRVPPHTSGCDVGLQRLPAGLQGSFAAGRAEATLMPRDVVISAAPTAAPLARGVHWAPVAGPLAVAQVARASSLPAALSQPPAAASRVSPSPLPSPSQWVSDVDMATDDYDTPAAYERSESTSEANVSMPLETGAPPRRRGRSASAATAVGPARRVAGPSPIRGSGSRHWGRQPSSAPQDSVVNNMERVVRNRQIQKDYLKRRKVRT
jgi:hypothetical protein